ncbi:diacylglycerol/lipid kinase family protein [Neotabrizicola sp. VNH66]|uniref:diacylglycerol/lipid kinase family protein n=1 Tax=Neotabrizicola sp. VNH66 TaxID=3400918 RepID=UPI003C0EC2DB
MPDTPICVIANAGSGKKGAARIHALVEPLRAAGLNPEVRLIRHGARLTAEAERARNEGFATIVAAGGDGTVCAVAQALAGSEAVLGIIPLGTFNFFARSLGLPETAEAAVEALIHGQVESVAAAEVNGRLFLNNASLGLYPALLEKREKVYAKYGRSRWAAYWSALRTLTTYDRPSRLRIITDGRATHLRSPMVFVAQNAYQLEQYGLQDGVDLIRQGKLAVYVAPELRRWQVLGFSIRMFLRVARPYRDFTLEGATEVEIETRAPRRTIARDGEREKMQAPFRFRALPAALRVIVPSGTGAA